MSCSKCNKKPLIVFDCRCGKQFCSRHKFPEEHGCDFDFKEYAKDKLKINNPKIINNKLDDKKILD